MWMNTKTRWTLAAGLAAGLALLMAPATSAEPQRLRIVGGLAGVNQYTRQEEPFWTRDLPRITGGPGHAEIVPSTGRASAARRCCGSCSWVSCPSAPRC
jgi:hypothetical protein